MGIFSAMKKAFSNTDTQHEQWNILTDPKQVDEVVHASEKGPQLIYKHSHTCGICHAALEEIEEKFDDIHSKADMHFVNVKKSRPVSDAAAEDLGVRHESPQVLIIDEGKCVWHKSHWSIKADAILEVFEK